jgi:hypothetical protein
MELLMKQTYFIKHDQRVRRILGCDRATLIFDRLEFYSKKQPNGFYKFLEPNSHKLYREGESWTELLGCHRTSFWRAFNFIGKKHTSQWAFEKAEDKFEGKLYASYYDRLNNRMFFIRNHGVVNEFFANIQPQSKSLTKSKEEENSQSRPGLILDNNSVRTEQNARSYKEAKKTSKELFKNNSHASNEIVKKMIEIWTAIVEEGRGQIELRSKRIAFLKKAFKDKFDNCLEKWKMYCQEIASRRFLMGEKTSWKASLDWALKFANIQKVLDGHYGKADRARKLTPEELEERKIEEEHKQAARLLEQQKAIQGVEQEIRSLPNESEPIKEFRIKWLNKFGEKSYREDLAECVIEMMGGEEESTITILPNCDLKAKNLGFWCKAKFEFILPEVSVKRIRIYHAYQSPLNGETVTRDYWFGGIERDQMDKKISPPDNLPVQFLDEAGVSSETSQLRAKLKQKITSMPGWLINIEVESITPDGELVVSFNDQSAVRYAEIKYKNDILTAATELWQVRGLTIQEKLNDSLDHSGLEGETSDEQSLFQEALKSLIGDNLSVLNNAIPF